MDKQIEMQNFLFALFRAELLMAILRALHVKPLIHYVKVPWFSLSLSLSFSLSMNENNARGMQYLQGL